ncbi:hypothetical protein SAMN05444166_6806 [Singulisphaera sp. GP187]|nr:hypothetical protein SAMN05444166_6806 [Singulisphaera sp. GP187]
MRLMLSSNLDKMPHVDCLTPNGYVIGANGRLPESSALGNPQTRATFHGDARAPWNEGIDSGSAPLRRDPNGAPARSGRVTLAR